MTTHLHDLEKRLGAATVADRVLDHVIASTCGILKLKIEGDVYEYWTSMKAGELNSWVPRYTESLDAAVGFAEAMGFKHWCASDTGANIFNDADEIITSATDMPERPALALCLATVRALLEAKE